MQSHLILKQFKDLEKIVFLLKNSTKKYKPYKINKIYTPDNMEYYDSLSFRFEKSVELFFNFFKGLEIFLYFQSSDTLRDRLLQMQKLDVIDDINFWSEARLLRNKITHSYLPDELKDLYKEIFDRSKKIFEYLEKIKIFLNKRVK